MSLVLDASAIGAALLPETRTGLAGMAMNAWKNPVHVPVHWPIEIVSLLVKAERDGRTSPVDSTESWAAAAQMIAVARIEPNLDAAELWQLVHRHSISAQDAAYLQLAVRRKLPLLTGDRQLARACLAASVPLPFDPAA